MAERLNSFEDSSAFSPTGEGAGRTNVRYLRQNAEGELIEIQPDQRISGRLEEQPEAPNSISLVSGVVAFIRNLRFRENRTNSRKSGTQNIDSTIEEYKAEIQANNPDTNTPRNEITTFET